MVKFETARDNISGRCKGKSIVELRCQSKEEGQHFLDSLSAQGVKFTVKA